MGCRWSKRTPGRGFCWEWGRERETRTIMKPRLIWGKTKVTGDVENVPSWCLLIISLAYRSLLIWFLHYTSRTPYCHVSFPLLCLPWQYAVMQGLSVMGPLRAQLRMTQGSENTWHGHLRSIWDNAREFVISCKWWLMTQTLTGVCKWQVLLRLTERCQSWEHTSLLLTFKRQRQVYLCTIEASFVSRVNSRSSRAP